MYFKLSHLLYPLLGLAVVGIHFSPFLASAVLIFMLSLSLFYVKNAFYSAPRWLWLLPLLLVWQCLAQFKVGWQQEVGDKLLLKLPLLFVPLLWTWATDEEANRLKIKVLTGINLFHFWIASASVLNYLTHYRFYNQMILESKPIPLFSQVYHIEFSMILAVFSLAGIFLKRNLKDHYSTLLFWLSLVNLFLVFFISVRTGMVCVIAGVSLKWLNDVKKNKNAKWFIAGMLLVVALLFLLLPGLKNRFNNTVEDLKTIATGGDVRNKSLGRRWIAWDAALKASADAPFMGFGMKGVEEAMDYGYAKQQVKPDLDSRVMPHNQFLDWLLQSGWTAALLLIFFFYFGLQYLLKLNIDEGLALWAALFISAFFESYLERQAGVLLFVTAWLMMVKPKKTEIID